MLILKVNNNLNDETLQKVLISHEKPRGYHSHFHEYNLFKWWTLPNWKTQKYITWLLIPKIISNNFDQLYYIGISTQNENILLEKDVDKMTDTSVKIEMINKINEFKNLLIDNNILIPYSHKIRETTINNIHVDWINVKNKCRTTVNKQYSNVDATEEFKNKLLLSEHSPIRLINIDWSWKQIPYWVSTELSRHKFEKYISTQRSDRTGIDRNILPQNAPVNFDGYANAQHLIDVSRKRLCSCATLEARNLITDLKVSLKDNNCLVADYMCPNCIYRGGCPEFKQCGFWKNFCEQNKDKNLLDLNTRYKCYNDMIYKQWSDIKLDNYKF